MVPWTHLTHQLHLDRVSRYSRIHGRYRRTDRQTDRQTDRRRNSTDTNSRYARATQTCKLRYKLEGAQRVHISANLEMADALWEGHTLLKTGLSGHRHTQTDRSENGISASFTPFTWRT